MDYKFIESKILEVLIECSITTFPIDCFQLLKSYGYKVHSYAEIKRKKPELYALCSECSDDAFIDRNSNTVFYNNASISGRIRFSLMHELGHHVLDHIGEDPTTEAEANYFASNLLSPRMAIHYANCKNPNDVMKCFDMTYEASSYAFDSYRRWRRHVSSHGNKLIKTERDLYNHFYNSEIGCFAWRQHVCNECGESFYNQMGNRCDICSNQETRMLAYDRMILDRLHYQKEDKLSSSFLSAEYSKLYGDDL